MRRLINWWRVRCAEGAMRAYAAHQGLPDRIAIARDARQLLRNAGWTDEQIDPWMVEHGSKSHLTG